jgi:hypothetical protein
MASQLQSKCALHTNQNQSFRIPNQNPAALKIEALCLFLNCPFLQYCCNRFASEHIINRQRFNQALSHSPWQDAILSLLPKRAAVKRSRFSCPSSIVFTAIDLKELAR